VEILNALASMIFPAIRELPKVKWQNQTWFDLANATSDL
jgi:hypothetical protein